MVLLGSLQFIFVFVVFVLVLYDHDFKFVKIIFQIIEIIGTCKVVCVKIIACWFVLQGIKSRVDHIIFLR